MMKGRLRYRTWCPPRGIAIGNQDNIWINIVNNSIICGKFVGS